MMTRPCRWTGVLVAACLVVALPSPAFASGLVETLAGDWRGSGMVRPTPEDAFEAVRCRISAEPGATDVQVEVEGRCASANHAGRFSIDLTQTGDEVTASLFVYDQNQTTSFSGARSGDRMALASSQPMTLGGVRYLLDLVIELGDGRMVLRESATPLEGGSSTPIIEIDFQKQ